MRKNALDGRGSQMSMNIASPRSALEKRACRPKALIGTAFNEHAQLPYGCTVEGIRSAMQEFQEFLGVVDLALCIKGIVRLEMMLMPANFSSIVGEFMSATIPKHCPSVAKNTYHNGHPDLVPAGMFPNNSAQHSSEGIEIKGSRSLQGWQGHNPEDCFLLVFVFDSNRPSDESKGVPPRPFSFVEVLGARISKQDWHFDGRGDDSRRTITARVTGSGYEKMAANWIYRAPGR